MKVYYIRWKFEDSKGKVFYMNDPLTFSNKEACLKYGLVNQLNFNCKVIDFEVLEK